MLIQQRRENMRLYVVNLDPPSPTELWAIRARAKADMGKRS